MKLIIMLLFLNLSPKIDLGEVGRYEVQIKTRQGQELKTFITIASYDKLETTFSSNSEFKKFIFNIQGISGNDSLFFFKKFYSIKYPKYLSLKENLISILDQDFLKLAKSDIATMQFISFQKIDHISLGSRLNLYEIKLLQTKPEFISTYAIDAFEEGYSDEWIISYNKEMKAAQIEYILSLMKQEYQQSTINCTQAEKSWIYVAFIDKWQRKLKKMDVFLISVIAP